MSPNFVGLLLFLPGANAGGGVIPGGGEAAGGGVIEGGGEGAGGGVIEGGGEAAGGGVIEGGGVRGGSVIVADVYVEAVEGGVLCGFFFLVFSNLFLLV